MIITVRQRLPGTAVAIGKAALSSPKSCGACHHATPKQMLAL
jgi:hypothetical protein